MPIDELDRINGEITFEDGSEETVDKMLTPYNVYIAGNVDGNVYVTGSYYTTQNGSLWWVWCFQGNLRSRLTGMNGRAGCDGKTISTTPCIHDRRILIF